MKLDSSFEKEIVKTANGDNSRAYKFEFKKTVEDAAQFLSDNNADEVYWEAVKKFGRVPVALCTAATILDRKDRLSTDAFLWASEVIRLWTNRTPSLDFCVIRGNLHPTKIDWYSKKLRDLTSVA